MKTFLSALLLLFAVVRRPDAAGNQVTQVQPELDLPALSDSMQDLRSEERQILDDALRLIQRKEHSLALVSLSRLVHENPKKAAFRVMRAYVLLQVGNSLGALDDARIAEGSGLRRAYRCWFLAQVAFLAGDDKVCKREIRHVSKHPDYGPEAQRLGQELKTQKLKTKG